MTQGRVPGRERLTPLLLSVDSSLKFDRKILEELSKRAESSQERLGFLPLERTGVNMQGRDQDNGELTLSDVLSESIIGDFDEAALDNIEKNTPTLSDAARLAQKRRRAEDLLERRRLREELGDDDFSFD